ncbi:hypothetical protein D9M70_361990 [compost metagenome]
MVGQVLDLRLGVLQGADVAGGEQQAGRAVQLDLLHRDLHHLLAAVAMLAEHFQVVDAAVARDELDQLVALRGPGPDAHLAGGATQHILRAIAGEAAEAFVDFDVAAGVALGDGDGVGAGVEGLGELLLARLERRLRLLARGDVAKGGGDAELALDTDEAAGHHAGQQAAVTGQEARLDVVQALVAQQLAEQLPALLGLGPEIHLRSAAADDLLRLPAEHFAEAGVDLDEHAVADARDADGIGAGLEQGDELLLRGRQALLAAHPFADVHEDAGHPQGPAQFVAIELGGAFQVVRLAVGEARAIGHLVLVAAPFQQLLVGTAHALAVLLRHTDEEVAELAFEGLLGQAVQGRGAGGAIECAVGDMPVPGAEVGRFQCQVEAFLAFLQGLFLGALAGDVAGGQHQAGVAVEFDLLAIEQADGAPAIAVLQVHFQLAEAAVLLQGVEHRLALPWVFPDPQVQGAAADGLVLAPAELAFETGVDLDEAAAGAVGDHHRLGRAAEGLGELLLALAQGVLGALALGGVEEGADQVGLAFQLDVLARQHAVEGAAGAGAQLDLLGYRRAIATGVAVQPFALLQVDPDTQFEGGMADGLGRRPAEYVLEMLVGLHYQAIGQADQQHHVRAQVEQAGIALLRARQLLGALLLQGDIADHADHPPPAVGLGLQAAADLQPAQAAVGPADTVAQGALGLAPDQDFAEQAQHLAAVVLGNQLDVVHRLAQWPVRIEAEQRLGAAGPGDAAAVDIPGPGAQPCAVQRGQQAVGVLPGLLEGDGVEGWNMGKRGIRVTGFAHARPFPAVGQMFGSVTGALGDAPSDPVLMLCGST